MRGKLFLIGCLLLTVILAACHYRIAETVVPAEGREGADSLVTDNCLYSLNANFQVTADTLWLHQLPLTDSIPVCRDDELVVAEISVHSEDTIGQRWVKVARSVHDRLGTRKGLAERDCSGRSDFPVHPLVQQFSRLAFLHHTGCVFSGLRLSGGSPETDPSDLAERH